MNNDAMRNADPQSIAQKLALWADILGACSARGMHFANNIYDKENYQKIQQIALEMLALATDQPVEQLEPLQSAIFSRPTPIACGDAGIIDQEARILLIRRADNKCWAMPGGIFDVGETPAQGVMREALEETGMSCEPVALVGVYDSRFCGTQSVHQLYQFTFLCRPLPYVEVINPASHAHEVLEMGWFDEDKLPDDIDPGHRKRIPRVFQKWCGRQQRAYFDRIE